MRTPWANALNDILRMHDFESLWYLHRGDFLIAQTEGATALDAGEVYMLACFMFVMVVMLVLMAVAVIIMMLALCTMARTCMVFIQVTDAILLLPATIVDGVEQMLLFE